ncbi:uncharacterized protein LOC128739657 [Sabethes cyaneus]|uniref:uncharacterized protein LOC128739657 n=1 Tax=Sabethes cyaneus TaxID=53552 RepID=UPI00237DEB16|nr:uncharacterized protein LOC128739657 [Sabethes cyaneus]
MRNSLVCCCFLVMAIWEVLPRPAAKEDQPVEIVSVLNDKEGNGTIYAHVLSDGTMVLQRTYSKIVDGTEIIVQEGSYSFVGTDNLIHKVYYISDENGYQARSTVTNVSTSIEDSMLPTKVLISLVAVFLTASSCFFHPPPVFTEKITDIPEFAANVTDNRISLRILEHAITPYDVNPEQLKIIGRYVFLAPEEDMIYLVGFEETINKSDAAKRIIRELVKKNSITSIYKSQRAKAVRVEKVVYL